MKFKNIIFLLLFIYFTGCDQLNNKQANKLEFKSERKYKNIGFTLIYNKDLNFQDEANFSKEFAEGIVFDEGFKYSDYKPGDKLAAVGIGGLVAGSLGVKAIAKSGLLVKLAKFWWILLAPLAFMGRFLSGKESSSSSRGRRRKR